MRTTRIPDNRGKYIVVVWHGTRRFVHKEHSAAASALDSAEHLQKYYQRLYESRRAPNGMPAQVIVYTFTAAYFRPRNVHAKKR